MSDFTDWGENEVCRILTGASIALPQSYELALLETVSDSSFTEASFSGYSRAAALRDLNTWSGTQGAGSVTPSNGTSRSISNNVAFDFGQAESGATITAVGVFNSTNMLCYSRLNNTLIINPGDAVQIVAGIVSLTLSGVGGMSNYAANALLDLLFRGQSFQFPSEYLVPLYIRVPDAMNAGGMEASGSGYARARVSQWDEPENGVIKNSAAVQFNPPTSTWGAAAGSGLLDSQGNMYFANAFDSPKTIAAGAGAPYYPAGSLGIRVQ